MSFFKKNIMRCQWLNQGPARNKNTHQLAAAVFSRRISLVAQLDSVLVLPVLERRPTVSMSMMSSVSTRGRS